MFGGYRWNPTTKKVVQDGARFAHMFYRFFARPWLSAVSEPLEIVALQDYSSFDPPL
jgi:hypothetical protein